MKPKTYMPFWQQIGRVISSDAILCLVELSKQIRADIFLLRTAKKYCAFSIKKLDGFA